MPEVEVKEFEERIFSGECTQDIREIVACLRDVAEKAGPDVTIRAHSKPKGGWGITFKRAGRVFCRFDPKPQAGHVWALVSGGDRAALAVAGTVSGRGDGPWVAIRDMRGAEQLVPSIQHAYDAAGAALGRRIKNP